MQILGVGVTRNWPRMKPVDKQTTGVLVRLGMNLRIVLSIPEQKETSKKNSVHQTVLRLEPTSFKNLS